MRRFVALLCVALCLALGALASPAAAQGDASETEAKTLFNAGVQAYKQGQFLAAAQAFVKAHELLPKSELLFSIAQAFRRQFDDKQEKEHLQMAVQYYRRYLDEVQEGGRRLDAVKALGELKPYLLEMGEGSGGEMKFPTRLSVTSPTPGAVVILDGGAVQALPFNGKVDPGSHRIEVQASGYFPEKRDFVAKEGDIVPFDLSLRGKPPLLDVIGADGADITVDGQPLGEAPTAQPLQVEPGRHFVAITSRGHKAYSGEHDFSYGALTKLEVDLPSTNQRRVAYGVMATGVLGFVGAGVLTGLALAAEANASEIRDEQQAGVITVEQRDDYNSSIARRDDFVMATGITAAASGAVTLVGLFLYLFDEPTVTPPARRAPEDEPSDEKPAKEPADVEMMGAPILGPGLYGVGVSGRF